MKKTFKFFMSAAIVAAGFTACSEDVVGPVNNGADETVASATLELLIDGGEITKAISDANATTGEATIKRVTLFIFGAAACEADTSFTLPATPNANWQDAGVNQFKFTFHGAPIGSKSVFVGINLPATLETHIKTYGPNTAWTIPQADFATYFDATNGFPMFNEAAVPKNIETGVTNQVTVPVKRLVAKVTAHTNGAFEANLDESAPTGHPRYASGAFFNSTLQFALGNLNTKIFPLPQTGDVDPNWNGDLTGTAPNQTISYQGDFWNDFTTRPLPWQAGGIANFVNVNTALQNTVDVYNNKYALENTHKTKQKGEVTYASVKATFKPQLIHSYDGSVVTSAAFSGTTAPTPLYVFAVAGTYYYYSDLAMADAFKANTGADYQTYYNGTCFYDVFLNPTDYNAFRNDYYQLTISKINNLGKPYAEVDRPIDPIDGEALLEVTILVRPWNRIEQPVILQ